MKELQDLKSDVRVLEELLSESESECVDAISHALTLMKELQEIKGLPEEKELTTLDALNRAGSYSDGFNACLSEVKLWILKVWSVEKIYSQLFDLVNIAEHLRDEERIDKIRQSAHALHKMIGGEHERR